MHFQRLIVLTLSIATSSMCGAATVDYYRFENGTAGESAQQLKDSGKSGLQGLLGGGSPVYAGDVPVTSVPNTGARDSLSLSLGTQDWFDFDAPFPFQVLDSATLEFWVKPVQTAIENDIVWGNDSCVCDANRFMIVLNESTGYPGINYRAPGGTAHILGNGSLPAPAGEWSYLAFVKLHDTYSIYMNNSRTRFKTKLISRVADPNPDFPTATGWTINGRVHSGYGRNQFAGLIDEVRISSKALKPGQFLVEPPQ